MLVTADRRYEGRTVVIAATGPTLTPEVAAAVRAIGAPIAVVSDAWRLFPEAGILWSTDLVWWRLHAQALGAFAGERWSSQGPYPGNDKSRERQALGLNLIEGRTEGRRFSTDPAYIHHGYNSGYAALNLVLLMGARRIVLVGYDMQLGPGGRRHFFGNHPPGLHNGDASRFAQWFEHSASSIPEGVTVECGTPSALKCFKQVDLADLQRPKNSPASR